MDAIASTGLSICKSKSFIPNNQIKSIKIFVWRLF